MDRARVGRLAGKVALITGAASGIGRATAALFHAEGAKVAATDRNEAGLKALGSDADLTLVQDVTDEARWRAVVDAVVAAFGRLDILVNSAGIGTLGNIETTTLADCRKVNAVNAEGTFLGCREAVRAMKENAAVRSSISRRSPGSSATPRRWPIAPAKARSGCSTKSAALHCARAGYGDSRELGPSLVRRNADGARRHRAGEGPRAGARGPHARRADGAHGQGRGGRLTILFLASDESSFTTGARIHGRRGADGAVARSERPRPRSAEGASRRTLALHGAELWTAPRSTPPMRGWQHYTGITRRPSRGACERTR